MLGKAVNNRIKKGTSTFNVRRILMIPPLLHSSLLRSVQLSTKCSPVGLEVLATDGVGGGGFFQSYGCHTFRPIRLTLEGDIRVVPNFLVGPNNWNSL